MLSTTGPLPSGNLRWEPKWDGFRGQALVDGCHGSLRVLTRTGRSVEGALAELAGLPAALEGRRVVLDGELVAGDGRPSSFYALRARLGISRALSVERACQQVPITLVVFDVLWVDGETVTSRPYRERRALLEELDVRGEHWVTTPSYDDGEALLAACERLCIEGGVAKAEDGLYRPGARSRAWVTMCRDSSRCRRRRRRETIRV